MSESHIFYLKFFVSLIFQRSAFPNDISREPDFSQKTGNFPSRAFGNILLPVPTQYRHSEMAVPQSRLRSGNIWEFPNENFCLQRFFRKCLKIWYYSRLSKTVLSSFSVPFISRIFPGFSQATGPEKSSLFPVLPIWEMMSSLILSSLV